MKRIVILFIVFTFVFNISFAQDKLENVMKQYSFETSCQYIFKTNFDSVSYEAYTDMFDYVWKLSAYNKNADASDNVPIGYTCHPGETNSGSILYYGRTVRYTLFENTKGIPVLGYALY